MKVCFITGEYPPMQGGIADYTRELASTLHGRGVEVSILTSARAYARHKAALGESSSFDTREIDPWPVYPTVDKWNFRSWPHILSHLHSIQPDVVHIQYETSAYAMHPAINLLPLWLKRQRDRPGVVTTLHDLGVPYLFPKAGRLRHKVTLALIRGSDRIIVTNAEDWMRTCALSQTGIPDGQVLEDVVCPNIHIVPIGTNIPANPPDGFDRSGWRAQLGVVSEHTLLSYFGFLNRSKGVETLLEALRALIDSGIEAKLLMVGAETGDSDPTNIVYRRRIVRYIADLGLEERVIWTGFSTPRDVSGHLLSSDICVLPFRDGASFRRTTLLTALAHGLPIISTKARDAGQGHLRRRASEQIVDGEHALLVATDNAEELKQAIDQLIQQPELRLKLGRQGQKLSDAFSWPTIAQKTLSVYEEVLQK